MTFGVREGKRHSPCLLLITPRSTNVDEIIFSENLPGLLLLELVQNFGRESSTVYHIAG